MNALTVGHRFRANRGRDRLAVQQHRAHEALLSSAPVAVSSSSLETSAAAEDDEIVAGMHGRLGIGVEVHAAVGPADPDDDHAKSLTDASVHERPAVERRAWRDRDLLQIQIEILGGRGELYEVHHRRTQRRLRELETADVIRRDDAVGSRPQQLRPRIVGLRTADDEQVRPRADAR